eukprot:CAMPEP_0182417596 /NCGR_PEP_ID=MMETSP1167-20130531/2058_1 /TAXON_ID=2988 /ORGANISM="Mallomonas Sp, Strain CCMP3275" /LENGTH=253 /DNA_ID=CAMNT_0024591273 /DNA_START=65 /DNA_END=822 /DNA_ORIENTATION=+
MSALVESANSAEDLKKQGNEAFAAKQYDKAIEFYNKAIALTPDNAILYSNRSACYGGKGLWKESMEDAKTCIEKDQNFIKGYFRLATAQTELKQYDDAIATLQDGLDKDKGNELFLKQIRLVRARSSANTNQTVGKRKQKKMDEATQKEVMQLQDETNGHVRDLRLVQAKLMSTQKIQRSNQVTSDYMNTLQDSVPLYRAVGKAFFLSDKSSITTTLQTELEKCTKSESDLMDRKEFLERRIASNTTNLQDLV